MRLSLFIGFLICSQFLVAQTGTLTIQIDGIKKTEGRIQFYLYNKAETHLNPAKAYKAFQFKVDDQIAHITLEDIPFGEYSLGLFHDENEDSICNLNFFGIPIEGYGFSRNYRPLFRAPEFEETNFKVDGETTLRISLIH